jgi:hypothetical protein
VTNEGSKLTIFLQSDQRSIDGQRKLHGEFWGYDRGDDQDTVKQQLSLCHSPLQSYSSASSERHEAQLTLNPDVGTGGNGKDEEETDKQETLDIVCRDSILGKEHRPDELSLGGTETCPEDDSEASFIWC